MAITNSDGSIILSTKVDTDGIKKGFQEANKFAEMSANKQRSLAQSLSGVYRKQGMEQSEAQKKAWQELKNGTVAAKDYADALRGAREQSTGKKQEDSIKKQINAYDQLKIKVREQTAELDGMKSEHASVVLTEGNTSQSAENLAQKMRVLSTSLEESKSKFAGVEQEANDLVSSFSKVGNEVQESAEKPKNAYQRLEETISEQKTRLEELRQEYASLKLTNQGNTTQAKKLKAEINNLSAEVAENEARIKSLGLTSSSAFAQMKSGLMALASYFIGIQTIFAAFRFSGEAGEFATQTEASVQRLVDIYDSASDSVGNFIDANARALGMSKAAAASFSSVYGNLFSVWADQSTNAELTNRYLNMTAVVASKTGRTVEDVQERVRSGLLGNTEAIEDLGIFVNVKTIEMTDAFQRMAGGKSWEQLDAYTQQQIRSMAILEQATAKYGDEVANTSATIRNRFNAAYQDFQNSWGNIVNTVLLPVLETLAQIFDIATKGLNALSGRSGQTLENVELQEENTDKAAENIEEQTKNQKELNKELKKSLAGFDDIQILSANTAENKGSGGANLGDLGLGDMAPEGSSYVEEANKTLMAIMGVISLALAAVGILLLFTGHIGWGIGFIIAGASMLTVTEASASKFKEKGVIKMLNTIMGVAGGALLALGIILLWIGGVIGTPVAIGMIIAGGASIVSAVASQAAFAPEDISAWLSLIMGIAGGALLALGVIMCMVGSVPLGVGMIIAGAVGLVSAVALNFDSVKNSITGWVAGIMAIAGAAMLVLGIILCVTGAGLPIGIALIAAGAAALITPVALNFNAVIDQIKGWVAVIMAIAGAALLVLGIILCATGAGIPLGIALIVAGAASLVTPIALNANVIVDWVKGVWGAIKGFWNQYIAPAFTAKFWLDLGKTCMNGLISGFEAGVNGIIWLFESMIQFIVDGLNLFLKGVDKVVSAVGDVFGGDWGVATIPDVKLPRVSIPRLAQGTVVPPNKEFMAVLGDNTKEHEIVSPISTMKQAFMEAMVEMGGNFGGGGNTEVVLEIDGREFGRAVVEQGNRENRRIGTRLVIA